MYCEIGSRNCGRRFVKPPGGAEPLLHFALLHCKYQIQLSGAKEKADVLTTLTLVIFQSGPIQIIVLPSNDFRRKSFQSALSRIHSKHLRFTLRQHPSDAVGEVFSVESFGEVASALVRWCAAVRRCQADRGPSTLIRECMTYPYVHELSQRLPLNR